MKEYWHRFPGRPDNIIMGKSRCEICGKIATPENTGRPIKEGWAGFEKHASKKADSVEAKKPCVIFG